LHSRTAAFLPNRQSVRWAAWERQKKLRKLHCFWQATYLRLSRVRLWSSMAEDWQDRFESIVLSFNAR
jgi:hypothetical protein